MFHNSGGKSNYVLFWWKVVNGIGWIAAVFTKTTTGWDGRGWEERVQPTAYTVRTIPIKISISSMVRIKVESWRSRTWLNISRWLAEESIPQRRNVHQTLQAAVPRTLRKVNKCERKLVRVWEYCRKHPGFLPIQECRTLPKALVVLIIVCALRWMQKDCQVIHCSFVLAASSKLKQSPICQHI